MEEKYLTRTTSDYKEMAYYFYLGIQMAERNDENPRKVSFTFKEKESLFAPKIKSFTEGRAMVEPRAYAMAIAEVKRQIFSENYVPGYHADK